MAIRARILLGYLALALFPAAALLLHPMSPPLHAPNGDIATTFWNFWWFDRALGEGRNPWECPILFAPFGTKLFLHTFEALDALWTMPMRWIVPGAGGLFLSWKLAYLVHAWWTGVAFHMLARALGLSHRAAFVGAAVFMLSPLRMISAPALSLQATGHALFLAWAVVRCWQEPASAWRGAWLGIASVMLLFSNLYYLFFCVLLFGIAGVLLLARHRPGRDALKGWAKQGALAFAIGVLPLAFVVLGTLATQTEMGTVAGYDRWVQVRGSAELSQFLLPAWARCAVTGEELPRRLYREIAAPARAISFALPLTLVAIAMCGWKTRRKLAAPARLALAGVALGALLMALGPEIKVWTSRDPADVPMRADGSTVKPPEWRGISVPSPYALVAGGPIFRQIRANARCGLFFLAAMLLLSGPALEAGVERIESWLRARGVRTGLAAAMVFGGCFFELHPEILQADPSPDDGGMSAIRDAAGPGGVREYPDYGYVLGGRAMYHQTLHGRPLLGGYISRDPVSYERWMESRPWGSAFRQFDQVVGLELSEGERAALLISAHEDGLRFIVVNRDSFFDDRSERLFELFRRSRLGTTLYDDGSRAVLELSPPP